MVSKFTKDINGISIDLKQKDIEAYNALKDFELTQDRCVVANFDNKSMIFMYSGISKQGSDGSTWNCVKPIMSLPMHENGKPFYRSGMTFSLKERYVELYHEEDANLHHGEYADVAMRKVYAPHIDNAQKAVRDAVDRGILKQAGYGVSDGRSADGRSFNEIRILSEDMSDNDKTYCDEASRHGEFVIFSDDASDSCKQFRCTREQKIEIRAGRYGDLPTRSYLDTLERARVKFLEAGSDVIEIDRKIADRKAFESNELSDDHVTPDEIRSTIESLEKMRNSKCDLNSIDVNDANDGVFVNGPFI